MASPAPLQRHSEVLVIGAGLAGAVVSERLAREGLGVTCLEQGRRHQPSEYPGDKSDFEIQALGPWHPDPNVRGAPSDYPINGGASEMTPLMFSGVGGSTILYGGHWMRFLPSDFRTAALDGGGDDWPIHYGDLAPYYDEVDRAFGVSGAAGDPAYPERPEYPMPPLPLGRIGERIAEAHMALGWHWWPGSNAIASRPYDGRRPCVQRGTCGHGCNEGAKGSTDVTHWPKAESRGVKLVTGARVIRLELGPDGSAKRVVFRRGGGPEEAIKADVIVVAANAVGTPRLLLLSANGRNPDGIANASGLVGARLMMHPFARVIGFFDENLGSHQGHWGQCVYSMQFAETDASRGFVRGAKWNLSQSGGPLQAALFPWPGERRWGTEVHDHVRMWLDRSAIWGISCEDLPKDSNRVTLDPELRDGDGVPCPRLTYTVDENSRRMLAFNVARAVESFEAAGATRTAVRDFAPEYGWHPLGTCRMGDDPERSVVNPYGRAHEIGNLFIADGSTFVTGSCVNPAATIAALALRSAEHILETRRELCS